MSLAKCPPLLRKIVDLSAQYEEDDEMTYAAFVKAAEGATKNRNIGNATVILASRLNSSDFKSSKNLHSLASIFYFYAKLQNPVTQMQKQSLTYDEIHIANETLSFYELLLLCRDFEILPKLITKEELKFLWKVSNIQRLREGKPPLRHLRLADFAELLSRAAILAYNKPGVKSLILAVNKKMLSEREQIFSLACYLKLHDYNHVKQILVTVGHKTVSLLNARSKGETNDRTAAALRSDLRGLRLAKALSKEAKVSAQPMETSTPPGAPNSPRRPGFTVNYYEEDINDDFLNDEDHGVQAAKIAGALARNSATGIEDNPMNNLSQLSADFAPAEEAGDRVAQLFRGYTPALGTLAQLGSFEDSALEPAVPASEEAAADEPRPDGEVIVSAAKAPKPLSTGLYVPGAIITTSQEDALMRYFPEMVSELVGCPLSELLDDNVAAKLSKVNTPSFRESGGPFVDIGSIRPGTTCTIKIIVTNKSNHELNVQVSTRGFVAEEVTVAKMPSGIAPGLHQKIFVTFRASEMIISSCLAYIGVVGISNTSGRLNETQYETFECPVFYRVTHSPDVPLHLPVPYDSLRCTIHSLPSLVSLHRSLSESSHKLADVRNSASVLPKNYT
jgi:hypothetical protein